MQYENNGQSRRFSGPSYHTRSSRSSGSARHSNPSALQTPHVLQVLHMPKLSGKPNKDAEAHLPRMNNWMDTHRFQDDDKVQRFCFTLTGETRLWHESLTLKNADWVGLQNLLRQQYSKTLGNHSPHMEIFSF